jgi:hypothetical protein
VTVIPIDVNQRLCFNCNNGYSNNAGLYCASHDVFIDDERAAQTCTNYESDTTMQRGIVRYEEKAEWEPSVEAVESYLRSLHATLFGRSFMVTKPEQLASAAEWVVNLFNAVREHDNGA